MRSEKHSEYLTRYILTWKNRVQKNVNAENLFADYESHLKGVKKTFTSTKMAISQNIYTVHTCYTVTPITGSGILSAFHIILQNFSETGSFWEMLKNASKGRF